MAKIATAPIGAPVSSKKNGSNRSGTREAIAQLAYQFFVERGYEHGHDQEDWLRAEAIIRSRLS